MTKTPLKRTSTENRYMFMRSPTHALDVIAELIEMEASLEEQDEWLKACKRLEYV